MAAIPMLIKPYDDEMMYSYLHRLAITLNMDYMFFWKAYIQSQYGAKYSRTFQPLRYDSNTDLSTFFSQIGLLFEQNEAISDFYRDHMMYTGFAPLLTEYQQARWINSSARAGGNTTSFITPIKTNINELRICPHCIGNNAFHIKRVHQMPGLKVCPVHGTPLLKYTGKQGFEFKKAAFRPMLTEGEVTETDKEYAVFAASVLQGHLETNANELANAIKAKMKEIGYVSNMTERLTAYINSMGRSQYYTQDVLDYSIYVFTRAGMFKRDFSPEKLLFVLFVLFKNIDEVKSYIQTSFPSEDEFLKYIKPLGYDLVSNYHRDVITLRHRPCGTAFITTPEMFMNGWECPICDGALKEKDLFRKIINRTYSEEYSLLSEYKSFGSTVLVKHLPCNKSYSVLPHTLFSERFRCTCADYTNSQEYADKVMEKHPEWKLIKFNGNNLPATLMHKPCGCVVDLPKFSLFKRRTSCEKCAPESFKKRLVATYGDRITALDSYTSYTSPMMFQCNVCGSKFSKSPREIFLGIACPECGKKIRLSVEEMKEYVKIISADRYEITGSSTSGLLTVRDNTSNESRLYPRRMILLELLRPSPSSLLPLDEKDKKLIAERTRKAKDTILQHLELYKDNYQCFFYEELYDALINSKSLSREDFLLGWYYLLPYDYFYQIRGDSSAFALKNSSIDYSKLLEKRYCIDPTKGHIGYFFGSFFLEQLGIATKKQKTISIVSNKNTKSTISKHYIGDSKLYIFPATHGAITEKNYKYKMILDTISGNNVENKQTLLALGKFIRDNNLSHSGFDEVLQNGYAKAMHTRLNTILEEIQELGIHIPQ